MHQTNTSSIRFGTETSSTKSPDGLAMVSAYVATSGRTSCGSKTISTVSTSRDLEIVLPEDESKTMLHAEQKSTEASASTSTLGVDEMERAFLQGEFSTVDDAMVDQIIELLDPSVQHMLLASSFPLDDVESKDRSPSSSPSTIGLSEDDQLMSSLLDDDLDALDEFDAAGRRKGGGPPQNLDGLSERRRQQILRRRIRNRESMRRMRARCKSSRDEIRQLEEILRTKRLEMQQIENSRNSMLPTTQRSRNDESPANETSTRTSPKKALLLSTDLRESDLQVMRDIPPSNRMVLAAVQRKIRELQAVEVQLSQQNSSLRDELQRFETMLESLRQHMDNLHVDDGRASEATFPEEPDRSQDFSWVSRIVPFLPQLHDDYDVYSLMQRSFQEVIVAARIAETYLARAHQVLGWRDTRLVNDTWVEFVFSKEIMHSDMETIAAKTWALQSQGVDLNNVMPQKHDMRVLRRINDNTLICARNLLFPGDNTNYCTVYLLLRVEYGDGYVVAQRTLEPENPVALERVLGSSYSYVRVFYGLMMSPRTRIAENGTVVKEEKGCHVKFGGRVGNGTVDYATSWAMDILVAILRWENKCVGPVLQLVGGDDDSDDVNDDESSGLMDNVPPDRFLEAGGRG
ncbi:hypothetical protein PINS_up006622 [Pythium insidiosum]|nr:hypothetical protein PINS_up006622 [Pythium insidiosum]